MVTAVLHKEDGVVEEGTGVTSGEEATVVVVRLATERAAQLVTSEADEEGDEMFVHCCLYTVGEAVVEALVLVTCFNKRFDLTAAGEHEGLVHLRFTFEEVLLWLAW